MPGFAVARGIRVEPCAVSAKLQRVVEQHHVLCIYVCGCVCVYMYAYAYAYAYVYYVYAHVHVYCVCVSVWGAG